MLGAEGVQIGTRFLASEECKIHENYKNAVVKAKDTDNAITGFYSGSPCRCIKSKYTKVLQDMEKKAAPPEDFEALSERLSLTATQTRAQCSAALLQV